MAITFTNNWQNILNKIQSVFRTEFKNTLPVFIGDEKAGSQYLRLEPTGTDLLEYNAQMETREYSLEFFLHFADQSKTRTKLDAVLRLVSRIEYLIHDNITMTLSDSSRILDCRIESTELDAVEDSEDYITKMEFRCVHSHL